MKGNAQSFVQATTRLAARVSAAGNHDFCPWANGYVYWLKQPIGWFVIGAMASLLVAIFLAPHAWIIFGSIVAVIVLGVIWPWVAIRGATAEVAFDCRRCREGELIQVRLAVYNRWPWPLWGLAVEKGFFNETTEPGERPVTALARVPGWSKSEFVFDFRPSQRGVYPHVAPELATGFPFGIWRAHRKITVPRELLVWPRTTPLTSIPSLGGDVADVIGMLFDRPGNEGDTIGVRPFREGDRLRSIHWAQTARRDTFIVTERQAMARRLVVIAVDLPAFSGNDSNHRDSHEVAIRVAASLAQEFHTHHAQVRFVMGSVDVLLEPSANGFHRLLNALARFQRKPEFSKRNKDFGPDAFVVFVTTSERTFEREFGTRGQQRFVLIDRTSSTLQRAGVVTSGKRQQTWIRLDSDADYQHQLRQQWERVCHASIAN
ncbi:MAG: DUF58 domain-containing protein [Planctomycetes bacterium]|nr:DUF58 domain-containing protein [Planctomycetota bacterium]